MAKKKDNIISLIETGADISGGIAGSVIGGMIAGPAGLMIGGASGPIITKVFKKLGSEFKSRLISNREETRIGATFAFALSKLEQSFRDGNQLRQDGFYDQGSRPGLRPDSEEVLEGIILSAQREYEERKVKFIGSLYANICVNGSVSRQHANQLIKTSNSLSYRQLCILEVLRKSKELRLDKPDDQADGHQIPEVDLIAEIHDLKQRGLIRMTWRWQDVEDNSREIDNNDLQITSSGEFFCKMLSLNEIEKIDLENLNHLFKFN